MTQHVGNIQISVSEQYPVFSTFKHPSGEIVITHHELQDLHYAVEKCMIAARLKLGPGHEGEV